MTTYQVRPGDSLSNIAKSIYGDISVWRDIASINPQITDPNKIYPGQIIKLPEQKDLLTTDAQIQDAVVLESKMTNPNAGKWIAWGFIGLAAALLGYSAWQQRKKNKGTQKHKK